MMKTDEAVDGSMKKLIDYFGRDNQITNVVQEGILHAVISPRLWVPQI